jgi:hypothetical protein
MAKKAAAKNEEITSTPAAESKAPARKTAAKKATASKSTATSGSAEPTARKSAAKKAATKKAAEAPAPSAVATASPIKPPAPVLTAKSAAPAKAAAPQVVQSASAGVIRPAVKRQALAPTLNATALYRQDRLLRAPGSDPNGFLRTELPSEYGNTRLSVLVRDANWLFMYWEISAETRTRLGIARGHHSEQLILRVYDITGRASEGISQAVSTFDVLVTDQTTSWYVQAPAQGRRYVVELGIARVDGSFTSIARSGAVQMPRMEMSREINWKMDDSFAESHWQILQLSGGGADMIGRLGASEGLVSSFQSRGLGEGAGFSASLFSGSLFSGEFSSGAIAGRQVFAGKERQFWLVVDAEVIVYGATEPDARVSFMGREIRLNPDGTFGIRMALPDAKIEFPVEATSADGEETRRVCPVVTRITR